MVTLCRALFANGAAVVPKTGATYVTGRSESAPNNISAAFFNPGSILLSGVPNEALWEFEFRDTQAFIYIDGALYLSITIPSAVLAVTYGGTYGLFTDNNLYVDAGTQTFVKEMSISVPGLYPISRIPDLMELPELPTSDGDYKLVRSSGAFSWVEIP